jgi:hypothetical protein
MEEVVSRKIVSFSEAIAEWENDAVSLSVESWYPKPNKLDYPILEEVIKNHKEQIYYFKRTKRC